MYREKNLNKYLYAAHPDATAMGITTPGEYAKDIDALLDTFEKGIVIDKDVSNFGLYFDGEDLERGNYDILRYIQEKFNAYTGTKHYNLRSIDNVPVYIMKYPALYDGIVETDDEKLIPLPYLRHNYGLLGKKEGLKYCAENVATFPGVGATHPSVVYGAYSKDFGGLIRAPKWSPVVENIEGYTWSKRAHEKLRKYEHTHDILNEHIQLNMNYIELDFFSLLRDCRLSTKIKLEDILNSYKNIFADDIDRQKRIFEEKAYYDRFLQNWDVTKGLVPGQYSVETREF